MRIRFQSKQPAGKSNTAARTARFERGHASGDALVTVAFLGVVAAFLGGAFTLGFPVVQAARENLHTSRILMQRAESLRLFTGSQVCAESKTAKPLFVEPYDPRGTLSNAGRGQYTGYASAADARADDAPDAGHPHMRPVTVTVCWTNYIGAKPVVHSREVQARLARNGAPKYIWGAL